MSFTSGACLTPARLRWCFTCTYFPTNAHPHAMRQVRGVSHEAVQEKERPKSMLAAK